MIRVIDASMVVAALIDTGSNGTWAAERLQSAHLAAPHLMPVEVANILRRAGAAGDISPEAASLAHADLQDLNVELFPYHPLAHRVWQLRENLTAYDAWYVALAEALNASLATLDLRMTRAPGLSCEFEVPPHTTRP